MGGTSSGFRIDTHEMESLKDSFKAASTKYASTLPDGMTVPRGGGVGIDRAMATALKVINEMHTILYEAMDRHSTKLAVAVRNYRLAESTSGTAVERVNKLVAMHEPRTGSEAALLAEYLSGRPAYSAQGPDRTPTIYGAAKSHSPDGRPQLAEVPDVTVVPAPRPWVQFQHQIISFDYSGLWRLIDELLTFVQNADAVVIQLATQVRGFCSPYKNYGDTVLQFNATFSQDAGLASGFHKVVTLIRGAIDYFAYWMATKEAWLEEFAHECGVPDELLAHLGSYAKKEQLRDYLRTNAATGGANFSLFLRTCTKVLRQAEDLRKTTATQILVLAQTIKSGGIDYYLKNDTHPGSADPGGLFNDGISPHAGFAKDLQAELAADGERLKNASADVKTALDRIGEMGTYGGQVSGVIGGVQELRKAEDLLGKVKETGSLADKLLPLLMHLGKLAIK